MKVLHIITGLSTGGAERMLEKLLARLDPSISSHVISLSNIGEIGPRISALGVPVEAFGMRAGLPNPILFGRLVQRIKALRPDVVHTWMYHADLLGGAAAKLAGNWPVGWCIRNGNVSRARTKFSTRAVVRICASLSRFIPDLVMNCSEVSKQIHIGYGYSPDRMIVVPNGFDLSAFRRKPEDREDVFAELRLSPDSLVVGLVGRFDPQKNQIGFIEAAGILSRRIPQARFVLVGRGMDALNVLLVDAIKRHGVSDAVSLLGSRDDVARLMSSFDVLASSSSYGEAFPNVIGEAMSCSVPCAVTDVGDSGLIVGETGRVVPPGDMEALATAVEHLLVLPASERRALGEAARSRIEQNFELGMVTKRYEQFYRELAGKGDAKNSPRITQF